MENRGLAKRAPTGTILGGAAILALALNANSAFAQMRSVPQELQGTWVVVSAERQMAPHPSLVGATVTFTSDHFKVERPPRSEWEGVARVDPAAGAIDMLHEGGSLVPPVRGDKWEGIYRVKDGNLEINTAQGHDARPTEFLSGYDLTLLTLRRK